MCEKMSQLLNSSWWDKLNVKEREECKEIVCDACGFGCRREER